MPYVSAEMKDPVRHYLANYAELTHPPVLPAGIKHVVVLPAHDEPPALADAIAAWPMTQGEQALLILVINARASDSQAIHEKSLRLRSRVEALVHEDRFGSLTVHLVDRASRGAFLPEKQGVGLARKIGCDLALALIERGAIETRWTHTTDADAIPPPDYFQRSAGWTAAALTYPFEHTPVGNERERAAIRLYDAFLRYHQRGLMFAGSPYAFQPIGSTIAIDARTYAMVRGFPRLLAGEDFYLLNKAAKHGAVITPPGAPILLSGRASTRVPFGTGAAVNEIAALGSADQDYTVYHPDSYRRLKDLLTIVRQHAADPNTGALQASSGTSPETLSEISRGLAAAFQSAKGAIKREQAAMDWLDGFRTLKLIHRWREEGLSPLPLMDALRLAPFQTGDLLAS